MSDVPSSAHPSTSSDAGHQLLQAISRAHSQLLASATPTALFDTLLESLLDVTGSEYGFIGEVHRGAEGEPYLETYAITNLAWDAATQRLYEERREAGFLFQNLDTLFGAALRSEKVVIANDPAADPRRGGLPPGHPPLRSFLGLPIHHRGELVGLVGIANRPQGYDDELVRFLAPLLASCGSMIQQLRADRARRRAEDSLRRSEARMRALFNTTVEAILTIDHEGHITSANPSAEELFGYGTDALLGQNVSILMPSPDREAHGSYLRRFLETGEPRILGSRREVVGQRRDGTTFPLMLSVGAFRHGEEIGFVGVLSDMTESKAVQQEMRDARDQAESASRLKSAFLANMSHEIRTPMTAIIGFADMLLEPEPTPDQAVEMARQIRRHADHLLALLNDVLDISKIEAGQLEIRRETCDLPAILAYVESLVHPLAVERSLTFRLEFDGEIPATIRADPLRLRQILLNLATNAVKFTDEGCVTLRAGMEDEGALPPVLRIDVEDTGIGIAAERIPELFSTFRQIHGDERGGSRGGTGLGLAISRHLARALGGDIEVHSAPGRGSRFSLCLPVPDAGPRVDARTRLRPLPEGRGVRSGDRPLAGRRILVVEDNPAVRRIVERLLQRAGATVETALHGREGVQAVEEALRTQTPFDAIVMDMQMPVLDGYGASRKLRDAGVRTPIVALTAHAMAGDAERCLLAGCDAYVTKPVNPQAFLQALGDLMAATP